MTPTVPEGEIRALERAAFAAWPAFETVALEGWLLRAAEGYTKRANSLNALAPTAPLADILPRACAFYATRGLSPIVRLTPLAGPAADATLARAGWTLRDPSLVMTRALDGTPPAAAIEIAPAPDAAWSAGFAAANAVPDVARARHERLLARISAPVAFARLCHDGAVVAWGLAVAEGALVGLFDLVVDPPHRGRGHGRRLVEGLLAWGRNVGAERAYLQVFAANAVARGLYAGMGFRDAYAYHYRIAPAAAAPTEHRTARSVR